MEKLRTRYNYINFLSQFQLNYNNAYLVTAFHSVLRNQLNKHGNIKIISPLVGASKLPKYHVKLSNRGVIEPAIRTRAAHQSSFPTTVCKIQNS